MFDVDRVAEALLAGTKALIAKEVAPLREENAALRREKEALEARVSALASVEPPDVAEMVKAEVESATVSIRDAITAVSKSVSAIPDLSGFARAEDVEAVRAEIPEPVELPPPPDLSDYVLRSEVDARIAAIDIPDPVPGRDGVGIADVKRNDDREVIVKLTDGETKNLGSFDGRDGIGFDHADMEYDGERTFKFVLRKDDRAVEHAFVVPIVIDRGIWREGTAYTKGDALTYGGDFWIAQTDTEARPGTCKDWRLAVRKGRDAKPVKL